MRMEAPPVMGMTMMRALVLVLMLLQGAVAELRVAMGSSLVVTPPGRDTLVECLFYVDHTPVDLSLLVVTWQLRGQMLVEYNESVTTYNPRTRVCPDELKKGNASLALADPSAADTGEYTCMVLYGEEHGQGSMFLRVEAKPYLSLENQVVVLNEYSQLSCSITGHYPSNITVQWLRNGQVLLGGVLSPANDSTDAYPKLISRYPLIPNFTEVNAIYTCRALHESLTSELETSFSPILGVRPIVTLQDRGWIKKRFLNFVCNVSTFYPGEISVVWLVNGEPSDIRTTTRRWRNIDGTYNLEESYVFEPYTRHNSALFSCVVHHGTILDDITRSMKLVFFSHLPNWMWYVFAVSLVLVGLSYLRRRVDDIVSLNDWIDGSIVTLDCHMKGRIPANISAVWVIKRTGQEQEIRETKVNRWSEDYTELVNRDRFSCSSTLVKSGLCGINRSFSSSLVFQVSKAEDDGAEFICRFMSVDKVLAEKSRAGVALDNKTYYSVSGLAVPKECVAGQMLILSCSLKGAFPQKTEVAWEKIQGEKRMVIWSGPGGGIVTTQDLSAPSYQITESSSENFLTSYLSFLPTLQDHDTQFLCRFFDDGGRVNAECRSQGLNVVRAMERKPDFCLSSDWGFESTNGVTQDESGL